MGHPRLSTERLVAEALGDGGSEDLGAPSWKEGLERLVDSLEHEARLHELGVEIAAGEIVDYLRIRQGIVDYARRHPEVTGRPVERPIVIVGQPRTGTTILYDLLARDPRLRAPLTWEVDRPLPPPDPATRESDPRIAEVEERIGLADALVPGFTDFHPMGALLAQECVRMTAADFRSMIFNTQYRVPAYNRWLLEEADMAGAYRWHRIYLEHLQALETPRRWLLKSPAHIWHLDALLAEYPNAVVIQTHRDPLKVVASVSALVAHLRQMASGETSIADVAPGYADDIFLGLERSMVARDRGVVRPERVIDVQFASFVEDPFGVIAGIYEQLGLELGEDAETRMRSFLAANPGDGGGGGKRYSFADTGLDAGELRERARRYQERFGVASEPVR